MPEKISIIETNQEIDLESHKSDFIAESIKVGIKTLGTITDNITGISPIGSIITELITTTIPNRRIENVFTMLEVLGIRVAHLEKENLESKMKTDEFQDLLQDGMAQSARALTKERLDYIASLLANSLKIEELKHNEEKKLLSILNELNDTEIIWLKYCDLNQSEIDEYEEKHKEIFLAEDAPFDASELEFATETITEEYVRTLRDRNLINEQKQVTNLGRLLLHYIGLKEKLS